MRHWVICLALAIGLLIGATGTVASEEPTENEADAQAQGEYVDITTLSYDGFALLGVIVASTPSPSEN